jgi:hypothetical protein
MIATFVDCPSCLMAFCRQWKIERPHTLACVVICAQCQDQLQRMLVSDQTVPDKDTHLLLRLELADRHWKVLRDGRPICPRCRTG